MVTAVTSNLPNLAKLAGPRIAKLIFWVIQVMHRIEERCRDDNNLAVLQEYVITPNDYSYAQLQENAASQSSQGNNAIWNESLQVDHKSFKSTSEGNVNEGVTTVVTASLSNLPCINTITSIPATLTQTYFPSGSMECQGNQLPEIAFTKSISEESTQTSQSDDLDQKHAATPPIYSQGTTSNAAIDHTCLLSSLENRLKDKDYEVTNKNTSA